MKNKYKLPPDIYHTVRQYVAGYDRRKKAINNANNFSAVIASDIAINNAVDNATEEIGLNVQDELLRKKLIIAIKENVVNKNVSFEYFDLQGISRYYFYKEKNLFIFRIAKNCNLV